MADVGESSLGCSYGEFHRSLFGISAAGDAWLLARSLYVRCACAVACCFTLSMLSPPCSLGTHYIHNKMSTWASWFIIIFQAQQLHRDNNGAKTERTNKHYRKPIFYMLGEKYLVPSASGEAPFAIQCTLSPTMTQIYIL